MSFNIVPLMAGEAEVIAHFKYGVAGVGSSLSGVPFGDPDVTRRIMVYVFGFRDASEAIFAMTIGGVSASLFGSAAANLTSGYAYIAHVPAGVDGQIVCTSSFGGTRHAYAVYSLYGKNNNTHHAIASTGTVGAPVSSRSVSLNCPAKGVIVGACQGGSASWGSLDEDGQFHDSGFGISVSSAHREFASAQTPYGVGVLFPGGTFPLLMAASFGP